MVWLVLCGLFVVWLFLEWERRRERTGAEPLVRSELFANRQLVGGLVLFFYQFLIQAGLFFTIPLYLSVALGLSAIATGVRILPLSLTLLLAAAGIPRSLPNISPRRVVRLGLLAMLVGIMALFASIDPAAGAEIVTVPLLLAGLGIGALASQLGAVTVSAAACRSSPTPTSRRRSTRPAPARTPRRRCWRPTSRPGWTGSAPPWSCWPGSRCWPCSPPGASPPNNQARPR